MTPEQIAAWTRDLAAFRPEWDVRYDMLDFGTLYVSSTLMRVWGMKWHDHALVTARRMVALGLMREHEILERPLPPHGAMYRFEKISREPGSRS